MAREVNIVPYIVGPSNAEYLERLKAFEALVRADEREACAKVIESHGPFLANGAMLADAIRARGNT
jgi:hypothetical protein